MESPALEVFTKLLDVTVPWSGDEVELMISEVFSNLDDSLKSFSLLIFNIEIQFHTPKM